MKVKRVDTEHNCTHQIYRVQVWGVQRRGVSETPVISGQGLCSLGETLPSYHSATFADNNNTPKINRSAAEKFRTRQK